ncbi:MAG: PH domain-containing protein [Anaerolineaceae bacterium]|nr:MAG: PH domain-containing protein [Anaerolineaceae bacterium]
MNQISLQPNIRYMYKLFVGTLLLAVLVIAFSSWMGYIIGREEGGVPGGSKGFWIGFLINLIWLIPSLAIIPGYYRSLRYEIRRDEVIVKAGVITKSVKHVPFRTVTNLKTKQDPLDRLFGLGALNIQTAGMSGQSGAEESLVGLPIFEDVYDQVAGALRRFRGSMAPTQTEDEIEGGEHELLAAILTELKAIRDVIEERN